MNIAEKLFNATCRIENLIWIAGAVANPEYLPEVFEEEFIENMPDNTNATLYQQLPALVPFIDNRDDTYELAYTLYDTDGFLIQASTPVKKYYDEHSFSFSWGHFYTAWLYAKDSASIADVVLEWATRLAAEDRTALETGK